MSSLILVGAFPTKESSCLYIGITDSSVGPSGPNIEGNLTSAAYSSGNKNRVSIFYTKYTLGINYLSFATFRNIIDLQKYNL